MYRKISAFIRKARDKAADLLDDFLWWMPPVFFIVVISAATGFFDYLACRRTGSHCGAVVSSAVIKLTSIGSQNAVNSLSVNRLRLCARYTQ